jgi:hypothetical protein
MSSASRLDQRVYDYQLGTNPTYVLYYGGYILRDGDCALVALTIGYGGDGYYAANVHARHVPSWAYGVC